MAPLNGHVLPSRLCPAGGSRRSQTPPRPFPPLARPPTQQWHSCSPSISQAPLEHQHPSVPELGWGLGWPPNEKRYGQLQCRSPRTPGLHPSGAPAAMKEETNAVLQGLGVVTSHTLAPHQLCALGLTRGHPNFGSFPGIFRIIRAHAEAFGELGLAWPPHSPPGPVQESSSHGQRRPASLLSPETMSDLTRLPANCCGGATVLLSHFHILKKNKTSKLSILGGGGGTSPSSYLKQPFPALLAKVLGRCRCRPGTGSGGGDQCGKLFRNNPKVWTATLTAATHQAT